MPNVIITLLILASPLLAQGNLWKLSIVSLAASQSADIVSSVGLQETNPALRGPNGGIDVGKAVVIKGSLVAVWAVTQWLVARHHPERARVFSYVNFGAAGWTTSTAIQNWRLH